MTQEPLELKTGDDVMDILREPDERRALHVRVWPEAARAFLDINQRNRTIVQTRVEHHAQALREDRFQLINNGLGVDTNGDLADGQHRLLGIVRADIPGEFWMITGLDPATREVIDTGRARTMKDTLHMHGYGRGHNTTAAALRLLYKLDNDMIGNPHSKEQQAIPHDVLMRYLEATGAWEDLIDATNAAYVASKGAPGLNRSAYTAFIYQVRQLDRGAADVFHDQVTHGAGLDRDDPVLRLRSVLAKLSDRRALLWHYALYIKVWNLYRTGRKVQNLTLRVDEELQQPH